MSKEESGKAKRSAEEQANALADRRARLRSSLTAQESSAPQNTSASPPSQVKDSAVNPAVHAPAGPDSLPITDPVNTQALELLGNIDHALSSCAGHLASLQKVASKQIDELKVIANTLQHQSISDVGLNINTLMESLTAAIEPMKAIGELVPALDRLVSVSTLKNEPATSSQLSEKQLMASLAEQLAAGIIDASTFKSACHAIFPEYDLNGLLHQLSELLGEQQLSEESFQVSFAALQSEQTLTTFMPETSGQIPPPAVGWADDTTQAATETAALETQPTTSEHEAELERQLADKERELAEYKEHLDERWQQLNGAYEEMRVTLQNRESVLQAKDDELSEKIAELTAKDSENQQLRAQMEELRDQTKEMVTDLQKQLAQKHAEEKAMRTAKTKAAATQPGFFELFTSNQARPENEQNDLTTSPQPILTPLPADTVTSIQATTSEQSATSAQSATNRQLATGGQSITSAQPIPGAQPVAPQSGFASPTASFVSAAGSYGSGVRAQVFEVIVRQALAGAHWREICAVPMQINNISPDEVESEVKRRQALLKR